MPDDVTAATTPRPRAVDELMAGICAQRRPVLAFMQNQWFRDPERVRDLMEGAHRLWYISTFLFMGCLSGRRIMKAFGEDLCDNGRGRIWFEEASPQLGGRASSAFPADLEHMRRVIESTQPKLVLAFGRIAGDALPRVWTGPMLVGPHPAARGGDVVPRLTLMAVETRAFLATNAKIGTQ